MSKLRINIPFWEKVLENAKGTYKLLQREIYKRMWHMMCHFINWKTTLKLIFKKKKIKSSLALSFSPLTDRPNQPNPFPLLHSLLRDCTLSGQPPRLSNQFPAQPTLPTIEPVFDNVKDNKNNDDEEDGSGFGMDARPDLAWSLVRSGEVVGV